MKTQNSVQLIGYLGAEPEMRKASNGSPLARMSIATDYYRRTKTGEVIHRKTWHKVIVWDQLAEKVPGNFITGSHILVQGEIRHRTYTNASGEERSITEIRAKSLLNLDR